MGFVDFSEDTLNHDVLLPTDGHVHQCHTYQSSLSGQVRVVRGVVRGTLGTLVLLLWSMGLGWLIAGREADVGLLGISDEAPAPSWILQYLFHHFWSHSDFFILTPLPPLP